MPPVRTTSTRSGKAERTHEENVERAFIAASRRCDRTLEARVESARRASEIHKARTGRALKITEKDVQNEEMYEEEDDLPLPYRHLTAGFQTSSPEFNRRFAAYLTTHVAIRTALEQSIIQSYAQQQQSSEYSSLPQFLNQQYEMFPSPMLAHQSQQAQQMTKPLQVPSGNRYSPYSIPPALKSNVSPNPGMPVSMSSNQTSSSTNSMSPVIHAENAQMMSMPQATSRSPTEAQIVPSPNQAYNPGLTPQAFQAPLNEGQCNQQLCPTNYVDLSAYGPMSTAMPAETQAFLGPNVRFGELALNTGNVKVNPYGLVNDVVLPPSDPLVSDTGSLSSGLHATLLAEFSNQDSSPPIHPKPEYHDEKFKSGSNLSTPSLAGDVDENDWRYFLNRNDPWPFSD